MQKINNDNVCNICFGIKHKIVTALIVRINCVTNVHITFLKRNLQDVLIVKVY